RTFNPLTRGAESPCRVHSRESYFGRSEVASTGSRGSKDPGDLFVAKRFDRIESGGFDGRVHSEEYSHRGRKAQAQGERPPGERDRKPRHEVHRPADGAAERHAEHAANR